MDVTAASTLELEDFASGVEAVGEGASRRASWALDVPRELAWLGSDHVCIVYLSRLSDPVDSTGSWEY